jgi:Mg2+/citrate symporter
LIGVAAAVQYAVFPVWFGISLVLGFPPADVTRERLVTLAINIVTIAAAAAAAYALVGMRREEVRRFIHSKFWRNG